MKSAVSMLLLLAVVSLNLISEARVWQHVNVTSSFTDQSVIGETDFTRSRKSLDNGKRPQIRNQSRSDDEVRRIRLDSEEDKPGIRAYGLPRKRLQDNGVIERMHVEDDGINDAPKIGRLVEVYGMPKDKVATNGFIERMPLVATVDRQSTRLISNEKVEARVRRSVRELGLENKVEEKVANEAEDMQTQDAKVFRPLFVYRQQMAARQKRKHSRSFTHRHHRYASHHYCDHHRLVR
ncbi:uncharacterized protein LOC105183781 [Harpegnathos saltator]|uniref:uncharacterized protein LOC105183781 n=1 Tax=Harpegnathos saltator TaxID=610380 RepID=UPI0005912215|nr:uncharacterized protein LOC105183781 [Harpegnathos saltator]